MAEVTSGNVTVVVLNNRERDDFVDFCIEAQTLGVDIRGLYEFLESMGAIYDPNGDL